MTLLSLVQGLSKLKPKNSCEYISIKQKRAQDSDLIDSESDFRSGCRNVSHKVA